jgi:hypothetical protein
MLPKEYYFKVAKVTGKPGAGGKEPPRKTISKVKINLASFCAGDTEPAPQDVFLQLKCAPARARRAEAAACATCCLAASCWQLLQLRLSPLISAALTAAHALAHLCTLLLAPSLACSPPRPPKQP